MAESAKEYGNRVYAFSSQGKFHEALELLGEALTLYPSSKHLRSNEIYILTRLGRLKEARGNAEAYFNDLKDMPFFLRTYMTILSKCEATEDIVRLLESGVFEQDFHGTAKPEFYINVAKTLSYAGLPDKAVDLLKKAPSSEAIDAAIEDISKRGTKRGVMKNPYETQFKGRKSPDVISEIEGIRMLSKYKSDYYLHEHLAERYKKTRQPEKAADIYKYILTFKDDDTIRNRLALLYKSMGLFDEAALYLKEGLLKNPGKVHLHTSLVNIFVEKGDPDGFDRIAREVLAVHPEAGHMWGLMKKVRKACEL